MLYLSLKIHSSYISWKVFSALDARDVLQNFVTVGVSITKCKSGPIVISWLELLTDEVHFAD